MRRPKLKPNDYPVQSVLLHSGEEVPESADSLLPPRTVRSIFLSDIHLGTRACQAERLLSFLRHYESEHLYLVGDIIDFWAMSRGIHWSRQE